MPTRRHPRYDAVLDPIVVADLCQVGYTLVADGDSQTIRYLHGSQLPSGTVMVSLLGPETEWWYVLAGQGDLPDIAYACLSLLREYRIAPDTAPPTEVLGATDAMVACRRLGEWLVDRWGVVWRHDGELGEIVTLGKKRRPRTVGEWDSVGREFRILADTALIQSFRCHNARLPLYALDEHMTRRKR